MVNKEEIEAGNKIIAEFIGLKPTNMEGCWGTCEYLNNNPNSTLPCSVPYTDYLYFDNSWDWLMEVVSKIEKLNFEVIIIYESCKIGDIVEIYSNTSKIESVWKAVVEFIKYYNEQGV